MTAPGVRWTDDDADAYRRARDLLTEVIAAIITRIGDRPPTSEADDLSRQRLVYVEQRRTLNVLDREETRRICEEYPALLRELQASES